MQQTVKPPADEAGWLNETAQLELYADEMRLLLSHYGPEEDSAGRGQRDPGSKVHEVNVLRGDKDLRWAQQQLRNCEREHAHLQSMLGSNDPDLHRDRLTELKRLETELHDEELRLKHLQAERKQRDRSLARAAEKAGGGELGNLTAVLGDGNAKAVKQAERLEAELEVWQVKNESLMKQVQQISNRLKQAESTREQMNVKQQALQEKLDSDENRQLMADRKLQEEKMQQEEQQLRAEIQELQEARIKNSRSTERTLKERSRRLSELKTQKAELQGYLSQLASTEQQLRHKIKQLRRDRRHERNQHRRQQGDNTAPNSARTDYSVASMPAAPIRRQMPPTSKTPNRERSVDSKPTPALPLKSQEPDIEITAELSPRDEEQNAAPKQDGELALAQHEGLNNAATEVQALADEGRGQSRAGDATGTDEPALQTDLRSDPGLPVATVDASADEPSRLPDDADARLAEENTGAQSANGHTGGSPDSKQGSAEINPLVPDGDLESDEQGQPEQQGQPESKQLEDHGRPQESDKEAEPQKSRSESEDVGDAGNKPDGSSETAEFTDVHDLDRTDVTDIAAKTEDQDDHGSDSLLV